MINLLVTIILIALVAAWMILFLIKIRLIEYIQIHGCELLAKMASCEFCLSWWLCVIIAIITAIVNNDFYIILYAVPATPICRKLL